MLLGANTSLPGTHGYIISSSVRYLSSSECTRLVQRAHHEAARVEDVSGPPGMR